MLFSQTGVRPSFTNDGAISIARSRLVTIDGGTLTNFDGSTLAGGSWTVAGTLRFTDASILANAATIVLDGSTSAIASQSNNNALADLASNSGSLTLRNSRALTIAGDFSNTGTVALEQSNLTVGGGYLQIAGATVLSGAARLASTGAVYILGGVLSGSGTIAADVINEGELDVGAPGVTGVLTINGNYTQLATGVLNIQIGGPLVGIQYDQLVIRDQATLDGAVNVSFINSFIPASGETFRVLTFASHAGSFASVTVGLGAALALNDTDGTVTA